MIATVRRPLMERKRHERHVARRRIAAHETTALSPQQRASDPLRHQRSPMTRAGWAMAAILGSVALHAAVVGGGLLMGTLKVGRVADREQIKIEMRERKVEPPPPPAPPAEPKKAIERSVPPPPKLAKAEPPPPEKPPNAPPPRVVGLSLESTVEGGGGPSFAVGNTRAGETKKEAVAPQEVAPVDPGPSENPTTNQVASRIPTAGVSYMLPKRRSPSKPAYPDLLKSQGIEADVTVMVTLDADGKVTSVKVIKPAPYPEFNAAARAAALAEIYDPARRDGIAIPYTLSFTYRFRLEDE